MTEATIPMQTTIACGRCGAALAPDQRYCLHCGAAHADPRVAYRELITPAQEQHAAPAAPAQPAPAATAVTPRDWTPVIALGGLAALALVLVVGVLIGKSSNPAVAPAAATPQVITIGSAPPAGEGDGTSDAADAKDAHAKTSDKQLAKQAAKDKQTLKDLQSTSGADYQKKSAKLPDTVALPGKPPPKDQQAPGGGSDAETIG